MFVKGILTGEIRPNGRIVATFDNMVAIDAPRPRTPEEVQSFISSVPEELEKVNQRIPGTMFETPARLGAGCCVMLNNVEFLKWASDRAMQNIQTEFGEVKGRGIVGHFRNLVAPGTFGCMDVCAGVATLPDNIA